MNDEEFKYLIQFKASTNSYITVAGFKHVTDANVVCDLWNTNREIYFITTIGETE